MPVILGTRSYSLKRTLECNSASALCYANCAELFAAIWGGVPDFTYVFELPVLGKRQATNTVANHHRLSQSSNQSEVHNSGTSSNRETGP